MAIEEKKRKGRGYEGDVQTVLVTALSSRPYASGNIERITGALC
jgi:hypothetical protein